jgi:hypothetical protein
MQKAENIIPSSISLRLSSRPSAEIFANAGRVAIKWSGARVRKFAPQERAALSIFARTQIGGDETWPALYSVAATRAARVRARLLKKTHTHTADCWAYMCIWMRVRLYSLLNFEINSSSMAGGAIGLRRGEFAWRVQSLSDSARFLAQLCLAKS